MVLAEELRQAVIQQAIQGKLTRQLETDRSVDDYLEQISNRKAVLIKNKEIKKEPALTGDMNEDMQLHIPDSWRWEKLGNLCSKIGAGSTPKGGAVNYVAEGVPFIREQNVYSSGLWYSGMVYITEEMNELKAGSMVKPNDLLLNITGGSIGRCALIPNDFITGNVNQHVLIIRLIDVAIVKYIHAVINSPYIQSQIHEKSKGDKEGLSATSTKNFWIPIPPIEEQQRIVDKINEIMPKIDEYEKIEKELEELKKEFPTNMKDALLQAAMQGKLTEQLESDSSVDELLKVIRQEKEELIAQKEIKKEKPLPDIEEEEIPFDIPENWRWVRLNEIGEIIGGGTPRTSQTEFWDNGDISWITPADMNGCGRYIKGGEKSITQLGLDSSSAKLFPKGSVVISSRAPIGYIAIVQNDASTSQGCKTFSAYIQELVLPEYIYYAIRFRVADMEKRATGTTFKEISGKGVGETIIPLPPAEEQQRIVERLDALLPLCEDLKEE